MYARHAFLAAALLLAAIGIDAIAADDGAAGATPERGRYLVQIGGCNDCHTPRYTETGGTLPEKDWLVGNPVGFRGPWGTSYPSNLRLLVQFLTEDQWLAYARQPRLPPMPWFALRDMSDADLRAIYRYIDRLGPKGDIAPQHVPPGGVVTTPYIDLMPRNLPARQAAR
jgi:mono/diheme cytochrome c family protein